MMNGTAFHFTDLLESALEGELERDLPASRIDSRYRADMKRAFGSENPYAIAAKHPALETFLRQKRERIPQHDYPVIHVLMTAASLNAWVKKRLKPLFKEAGIVSGRKVTASQSRKLQQLMFTRLHPSELAYLNKMSSWIAIHSSESTLRRAA